MVQMAGPSVWDERLAANDPTLFLQHITRNKIGKLDAAYCGILLFNKSSYTKEMLGTLRFERRSLVEPCLL
jgi:hypothetical protein